MHHISPTAIWISNFFLGGGVSTERGEDCFAQARIQRGPPEKSTSADVMNIIMAIIGL